ncbi:MAG: gliding motility-associated C-terminal domain-containing protein, partial [Chitinophagales bacterium]
TVLPDPGNIMFVPNTFTPNGDNVNDYFFVYGYNFTMISRMEVYDRWGELVFSAENVLPGDVTKGWDGTFNGQPVNNGVYAYIVQVQFETGQKTSSYGNVTLIR